MLITNPTSPFFLLRHDFFIIRDLNFLHWVIVLPRETVGFKEHSMLLSRDCYSHS